MTPRTLTIPATVSMLTQSASIRSECRIARRSTRKISLGRGRRFRARRPPRHHRHLGDGATGSSATG